MITMPRNKHDLKAAFATAAMCAATIYLAPTSIAGFVITAYFGKKLYFITGDDKFVAPLMNELSSHFVEHPNFSFAIQKVQDLSQKAGIAPPKTYFFTPEPPKTYFFTPENDCDELQSPAFLAGEKNLLLSKKHFPLKDKSNKEELSFAIAHEISHIKGQDIRNIRAQFTLGIFAGMGMLESLAFQGYALLSQGSFSASHTLLRFAALSSLPLLFFYNERQAEFSADIQGAKLVDSTKGGIEFFNSYAAETAEDKFYSFLFTDDLYLKDIISFQTRKKIDSFFGQVIESAHKLTAVHPSDKSRIKNLKSLKL